ncbi:MAG: ABC-2 transporter permease [Ruminococcus flavefaciens]|nr:ABC-2 transporter permease [Ruminococcus flavefaciens]MCM1229213.1 ABC-2 transporter permease [Ruminococcus flavefaciens]
MKGLLLKEFIMLRKSWFAFTLLIAVFSAIAVWSGELQMLLIAPLFVSIWLFSFLGMDEQSRWKQYSATLPYERSTFVSSKYLIMIILNAVSVVFITVCYLIASAVGKAEFSGSYLLMLIIFAVFIGLIYPTIILPLNYRFSTEKSRIILMIINGAMGGVSVTLMQNVISSDIVSSIAKYIPLIILAVTAVLFVLSWLLSIRIYEKKDI